MWNKSFKLTKLLHAHHECSRQASCWNVALQIQHDRQEQGEHSVSTVKLFPTQLLDGFDLDLPYFSFTYPAVTNFDK